MKRWAIGGLNSFLSAAGASVGSGSAASYFGVNATTSLKIAGVTAIVAGIVSLAKWMAQHPIPGGE